MSITELGILHLDVEPSVKELMVECYRSTELFCTTFFPEVFNIPFADAHREIFRVIDDPKITKVVIQAPRGIGKSSIAKAYAAKALYYQMAHFVVYISQTSDFAVSQTEAIKQLMNSSSTGIKMFGNPGNPLGHEVPDMFSKLAWFFNNGSFILPRGSGQQIRGSNVQVGPFNFRPDLIIADDLENMKNLNNEQIRIDTKAWWWGDVMKTKAYVSDFWKVVVIDTLKHPDGLLKNLMESSDWQVVDIAIAGEDLVSNFPDFITDKEVEDEYKKHEEDGMLDVFYREWLGLPISTKDASFKREDFQSYEPDSEFFKTVVQPRLLTATILDPAKTIKIQSAKSGLAVVSIDPVTGKWYIRLAEGVKMYPDDLYEYAVRTAMFFDSKVLAYETTGLEEFIIYPLEKVARERHFQGSMVKLTARRGSGEFRERGRGKEGRVAGLIPYYRQGEVYHHPSNCQTLEAQLISFPNSRFWDTMDATAYFPQLLKMADFFPSGIREELYNYEEEDRRYDEMLAQEEPPFDGWRQV